MSEATLRDLVLKVGCVLADHKPEKPSVVYGHPSQEQWTTIFLAALATPSAPQGVAFDARALAAELNKQYHEGVWSVPTDALFTLFLKGITKAYAAAQAAQGAGMVSEEQFAVVAIGEGAQARTATERNLRKVLHDLMCLCGVEFWYHCRTEGIREAIETLDDDNNWTLDEDKRKFSISVCEHETGNISVYALLRQPPSAPAKETAVPTGPFELTSVNYDPVMARTHLMVPKDMKCHKCGADEPWKDPLRKEVAATLESLSSAPATPVVQPEAQVMERVAKWRKQFPRPNGQWLSYSMTDDEFDRELAALVTRECNAARLAALEQAIKAQCYLCRAPEEADPSLDANGQYIPNFGETQKGEWVHRLKWGGHHFCEAGPIRALAAAKEQS